MLPAILVTFATFFLELCMTSPVYNMQPAFITANIGTTGRNIRNLPCISRKTSQSGVCMFAIDCLKANGTHLGTCIDRFYFGSCCHIEPIHDVIDNTIDTDIIPAREPPQRLSSTIVPITSPKTESVTTKTTTVTTTKSTTTTTTTTSTPKPVTQEEPATTVSYKLTTFQSVDGNVAQETTTRSTTVKPTTAKSKPTKPTVKPSKTTSKPTRPTFVTKKPSSKPEPIATKKPVVISTRKPITTTTQKPTPNSTKKPTVISTRKPITTASTQKTTSITTSRPNATTTVTKKPATTTTQKSDITITRKPITVATQKPNVTTTRKPVTSVKPTIASSTTEKPSTSSKPTQAVNTNGTKSPSSNEIETTSPSSIKPSETTAGSIVTWTVDSTNKNASLPTTNKPSNSTSEEWVPLTTPDKWVPLPSVQPSTTTEASSSGTSTTVVVTTESASKPSITYIPLESTTSSATLNASTTASAEIVSSQSSPVTTTVFSSTTEGPPEIRPVNMSDFTDVCGRRMYPEGRIVGGEKASFGKWPWQISLRQWRTSTYLHKCGAALLNENWAITAAHCVDNVPPSDLLLRLGEHDLSTESEPYLHQERRVQIVASHPQFDPRTFEYDLALLRFYEPVTFQPNILPVCVPQTDENFVGRTAYVTGWGRLYEDGPLPSILQEVSVPVINNSVCESMYRSAGYIEHIPHIFICAGWRRGGFDSCEGDSGGPMVIQRDDKRFLLAGVISWGIGCAEPNQPGVYTRISEFRDWINQILQF